MSNQQTANQPQGNQQDTQRPTAQQGNQQPYKEGDAPKNKENDPNRKSGQGAPGEDRNNNNQKSSQRE